VLGDAASGRVDCLIVGTDRALYHQALQGQRGSGWAAAWVKRGSGSTWSEWTRHGGGLWSVSSAAESLGRTSALQFRRVATDGVAAEAPACVLQGTAGARQVSCLYRLAKDGSPVHGQWREP
jgi:hypothetical protein